MPMAYIRCRDCEGTGMHRGEECGRCEGHGGYWIVLGPGMRIRIVMGDADDAPDDPAGE